MDLQTDLLEALVQELPALLGKKCQQVNDSKLTEFCLTW